MSNLETISGQFNHANMVRNHYKPSTQYVVGHPDTLSDGDELGKDEYNGSVGSLTDIHQKTCLLAKNKYNNGYQYDSSTA